MKKPFRTLAAVLAAGTLGLASWTLVPSAADPLPSADAAAVDYFLKIDGIEGESRDERHKGEIEISSFSWGVSQTATHGTGGGGGAGKATFQDLHFTKLIDKSSPLLFQAVPAGTHFPKATLVGRKTDGTGFLKVTFSDVLISSFQEAGNDGSLPMEQVSLNFAKIEFEYVPQGPDGKPESAVKGGWDLKANKKV